MIRIALSVALIGAVLRGDIRAQDRDAKGPFAVKRDFSLTVAARDGTKLATDVYRPDTPNRVPALLVRTPYNRTGLGHYREGHYWASHGYAYVVQDVRGRGDSEGRFDPLVAEGADGYRAQSWIAGEPWSNGRVGTLGGSYLGWTQVFTAPLNNPALRAMIPAVTPPDPGGYWPMRHGGISFGMVEWAMAVAGRTRRDFPEDEAEFTAAYRSLPLASIDRNLGAVSPIWQQYLAKLEDSAYWQPRSYQPRLPASRAPMLHITGWYDGTLGGSLQNFEAMRTGAAPRARNDQYLVVGPWRHWIDSDSRGPVIGGMDFGPGAVVDLHRQYRMWFARYLGGDSTAIASWSRVRVFLLGSNRWIGADDWPLPGTRFVPFYLRNGKPGDPATGRLTAEAPGAGEGSDRYDYDPGNATPFLWTRNVDSGGPDDYRPVEARPDVLSYSLPAPADGLTVCGPIRATIVASSSARDTDWVARLSLVRADGYSQRLTDGWIRARARHGDFRNDPLVPGQAETYQLDLWGTCVQLRAGEQLRLAVMSAAFPVLDRNLNTGESLAHGTRMVVAHQAVWHETGRLSSVTLPIVDHPREIDPPPP
jgi:putative CocE/NonD family hydrolase